MAGYPNRCQHLKVNGTQCGSPALRRNRYCFFHKRFQDERIRLNADRARRGSSTFILPVLEDANSIQMAIMQVMRLLVSNEIEHKTASLLLYALQTASSNLRLTKFDPFLHDVVLDPRHVPDTPLRSQVWTDHDFEDDQEKEAELDPVEAEAEKAAHDAAIEARRRVRVAHEIKEEARQRRERRARLEMWAKRHPEANVVRDEDRRHSRETIAENERISAPPKSEAAQPDIKKPAATVTTQQVREQIVGMVHEHLPALTRVYNEALRKEEKKETT